MLKESKPKNNLSLEFSAIYETLTNHLQQLDAFLQKEIQTSFEDFVGERVRYVLNHQGKRLRPLFAFFSGWKEGSDNTVNSGLVKVAAIVELIHLASLVHDDILDEATLRHQTPSVPAKYGEKEAVLIGDSLFAHAFKLTTDFSVVEICRMAAESVKKICAGEIVQTLQMKSQLQGKIAYDRIIDLKTGELFWLSCALGAKVGVGDEAYEKAVGQAGRRFGIAYQMYDDLMDIVGDEKQIGKTLGTDLATGKMTLPLIYLMESLSKADRETMEMNLKNGTIDLSKLQQTIEDNGIVWQVKAEIGSQLQAAVEGLLPYAEWFGAGQLIKLNRLMQVKVAAL